MRAVPVRPVTPAAAEVAGLSRWARLPGFCGTSVAVGVGGHQVAHGTPASMPALTLAIALVSMTWYALSRHELSAARLTLLVWLSQLEVHLALLSTSHDATHHATTAAPQSHPLAGWQMLLAHALAGLVVSLWLRRGESSTWRLIRQLVHLQLPFQAPSVPDGLRPRLPLSHRGASLRLGQESRCLSRRGPPTSHA
jgi:hypothetical protein